MLDRCLWTDTAQPLDCPRAELPDRADVAVVGGGYTGLSAARTLARHGAEVVLLERQTLGSGASGRNGGFVLPGFKPAMETLARRHGLEVARRMFAISLEAVRAVERLVAEEGIACDYARRGGVTLAARPRHLAEMGRARRFLRDQLGYETELLGPGEIRQEIGSKRYHGGLVDPGAAGLQPAKYVRGLALAALRAGARLIEGTEVRRMRRTPAGFELLTSAGAFTAKQVFVATNGYSGPAFPTLRRRIVPIGSYLIATAPLAPGLARQLVPNDRVLSDSKHLLFYFRLSPEGRMVFGGRASFTPTSTAHSAEILETGMREVFPELAGTPIEYAWAGKVGFTTDRLPHAGQLDGVHYAMGYCGHGVALSTYLGSRMGDALAGREALPDLDWARFRPIPLYRGWPWFLPVVGGYYRIRDWLGR